MSRIDDLIKKHCPDGVEYTTLGRICTLSRGCGLSKEYLRDNIGEYPVYSSQTTNNGVFSKINKYVQDGTFITWTTGGANAGSVFYRNNEKFSMTGDCGAISNNSPEKVNLKFLYYILCVTAKSYVYSGMGNPKLMIGIMSTISVPLPPLEVQEEIVRILDTFTKLEAELKAELKARQLQYSHYRDELLNFDGLDVEWMTLKDVTISISAGGDLPKRYLKGQTSPTEEFSYPIYSNGINEKSMYGFTDVYKVNKEAVTISARGTIGWHTIRDAKFTPIVRLIVLIPNNDIVSSKFLNYILDITEIGHSGGSIPQLTVPNVKKIKIPVPSLEEQERIVSILDKFEAITNSLQEGLPREIELRQKQYEYYRDQLLNFPKPEEVAT